jgi:hypothetical protein
MRQALNAVPPISKSWAIRRPVAVVVSPPGTKGLVLPLLRDPVESLTSLGYVRIAVPSQGTGKHAFHPGTMIEGP